MINLEKTSLFLLFIIYKIIFDFLFLPVYHSTFAYLISSNLVFDTEKIIISWLACFVFLLFFFRVRRNDMKTTLLSVFLCICIIPMLGVYALFESVTSYQIIYPFIFWIILFISFWYFDELSRYASGYTYTVVLKRCKNLDYYILFIGGFVSILIWAWAGFPFLFLLSGSTAQRLALREASMPVWMGYIFYLCGGLVMPYIFSRFLIKKEKICTVLSFLFGYILYCVNGMKTWLFLYVLIFFLVKYIKAMEFKWKNLCYYIVLVSILMCFFACFTAGFGVIDYVSQVARILAIPNSIAFRSISFFENNELLYLRESILRSFFDTPYIGGSDFYITYGSSSDINSSRANNGLWGDSFRNFGLLGILIYPIIISKVLSIVKNNTCHLQSAIRFVVMFMIIWSSINVSFFTWLLTGGVLLFWLILKLEPIDKKHL